MRCPTAARLARAASGEDDAVLAHAETCERCATAVREARALRAIAALLPDTPLTGRRRQLLENAVLAIADAEPPPRQRPHVPSWLVAAPFALTTAAAVALWLGSIARPSTAVTVATIAPSPSPSPTPSLSPSPSPTPSPFLSPTPSPSPTPTRARPAVTAVAADYDLVPTAAEHRVVLRAGRLAIDGAPAPDVPVHIVTTSSEIRATGARFEARGARGVLRTVRVFAGSVEITTGPRVVVVSAGETWTLEPVEPTTELARTEPAPVEPAPELAPLPPPAIGGAHFSAGWEALRAGRFAEAAAAFERARGESGVQEDAAYWSAVAWARAGDDRRASDAFSAFLAGYPTSPRAGEAHLALARRLTAAGALAAARTHVEAASADPDPRIRAAARALAGSSPPSR